MGERSSGIGRAVLVGAAVLCLPTWAQQLSPDPPSLYVRLSSAEFDDAPLLEEVSTLFVQPPEPREFRPHDLVTIIIDESTRTSSSQSMTAEREYDVNSELVTLVDPWELLEARLRSGSTADLTLADVRSESNFDGEGESETVNRFSARLTAEVIDVKPNRTLVIQARRVIVTDDLTTTMTLTGTVRADDVTEENTVDSEQIANLRLEQHQEGDVRRAAQRSLIGRVLDAMFSF